VRIGASRLPRHRDEVIESSAEAAGPAFTRNTPQGDLDAGLIYEYISAV